MANLVGVGGVVKGVEGVEVGQLVGNAIPQDKEEVNLRLFSRKEESRTPCGSTQQSLSWKGTWSTGHAK